MIFDIHDEMRPEEKSCSQKPCFVQAPDFRHTNQRLKLESGRAGLFRELLGGTPSSVVLPNPRRGASPLGPPGSVNSKSEASHVETQRAGATS